MQTRSLALVALVALVALGCGDDAMPSSDASFACVDDVDCDDGIFCNGAEVCGAGGSCQPGDVPCADCDELTDTCTTECPDADGDGHEDIACGGDDCDDADPNRYPGNPEVCGGRDFHDEDCDPTTFGSDGDRDGDGEISALCCNPGGCGGDCDDNDPAVLTGQIEICDSKDNDCDGNVDEDPNEVPWYPDTDMDLFGDPDRSPVISCTPIADHSIRPFDCDDSRPTVNPAAIEQCNDLDDDCDGVIDEGLPECSPCDPNPCQNDGLCRVVDETRYVCECTTGFVGTNCLDTCDVSPAFPEAPEGRATERNHVRNAATFVTTHRDDGMVATCGGPCASAFAADGQRCGDDTKAPVVYSAIEDAAQAWRADWSLRGAKRIDRVEIYPVRGAEAAGLDGAEIRIDGILIGTYPDGATEHAIAFDPPLYGSSVEVRKTSGVQLLGLAEVEVWGAPEAPVTNVAFLGAASQSSIFAPDEGMNAGQPDDRGATLAVDGRNDTIAATKGFLRAGSLDIASLTYPFETGNQDEPPLVGRDDAWWYLNLGRPQAVRSLEIHRGPTPALLDGAEVYLELGGSLEGTPRWTLTNGATGVEVLRPSAAITGVTGIKIVSAVPSTAAPGDPNARLEIAEVRVWANTPALGAGPMRNLSLTARAELNFLSTPPLTVSPHRLLDGRTSTLSGNRRDDSTVRVDIGEGRDVRRLEIHHHGGYPGTLRFRPDPSCPFVPICGDTYGACTHRAWGTEVRLRDGRGGQLGPLVGTLTWHYLDAFDLAETDVAEIELYREQLFQYPTPSCSVGYQITPNIDLADIHVFGYWGSGEPGRLDYARRDRAASVSHSPPAGGAEGDSVRAIDGWPGDWASTTGVGPQELRVELGRPVFAERIRIEAPSSAGADEARVEVRLDGGQWMTVTTLPNRAVHELVLPSGRLIDAVRLVKSDSPLSIGSIEVLAEPRY